MQEIDDVLAMVKSKPEHVIKAEGDGGNSEAAWIMDLGLEMGSNALAIAPLRDVTWCRAHWIRTRLLRRDLSLTAPSLTGTRKAMKTSIIVTSRPRHSMPMRA